MVRAARVAAVGGVFLIVGALGVGALWTDEPVFAQQHETAAEIFCEGLGLGQFCLQKAPSVLGLTDAQAEAWTEAALRYNRAVDTAATQLVEESGAILSPDQLATLEQWFDKGLNVVLNQVLLATTDGQ